MTAWLRRGAAAAALASRRSDLWSAGSLAWLAYLGWIPLLLVVAPPQAGDLAGYGVQLVSSGAFPANVILLSTAVVAGIILLYLLAAVAEVAVARGLDALPAGNDDAGTPTLAVLAAMLLASVPAAGALTWLLLGAVESAPTVYSAPGTESFFVRLAATLVPQLTALAGTVLMGQVAGGAMVGALLASGGSRFSAAARDGLWEVARRPGPALGTAAVAWLKDGLLLVLVLGLLRVLWEPIGRGLGPGMMGNPEALVLLLGFIVIWLVLLLVGGALHAFISAWRLLDRRIAEDGLRRPADDAGRGTASLQGGGER